MCMEAQEIVRIAPRAAGAGASTARGPGRRWFALSLSLSLVAIGCGASSATLVNAAVNTSVAAGASVARRAGGQCYTWCEEGTRCDPSSGYCVALPCRGRCRAAETCAGKGLEERCVLTVETSPRDAPAPPPGQPAPPPKPPWLP